ncbi:MAG: acyltransferase family protein [Porticoccaceae bacterium]
MMMAAQSSERGGEIAALTGLRGFAALWVLVFHVRGAAGPRPIELAIGGWTLDFTPFFSIGWAGVQVFFVLSGFLLALPYVRWSSGAAARPRVGPYLARRCARVLPGYYLQLFILIACLWLLDGQWVIAGIGDLIGYAAMLFIPEPLGVRLLNGMWWTLPIEFSFYLVLPLLADLLRGWRVAALLVLGVGIMIAWRGFTIMLLAADPPGTRLLLGYQLPGALDSFALGMAAAVLYQHGGFSRWLGAGQGRCELLALAGIALGIVAVYWMEHGYRAYWTPAPITFLWTPLFSLATATVILAATAGARPLLWLFANPVALYLGTVSYGIYLWHFPLLQWLVRARPPGEDYALPWLLPACLGLTVAVAALSWHWVEQPVIARVRLALTRRRV